MNRSLGTELMWRLILLMALPPALNAQAAGIVVDGRRSEPEWVAATRQKQGEVVFSQLAERDAWYFAIESRLTYPVYVDLYFADDSGGVLNLHASQKVGRRSFSLEVSDEERPAFEWGEAPGWEANVGNPESNGNVYEFRVARAMFEGRDVRLRLAMQDFYGRNPPVVFPATGTAQSVSTWMVRPR